ncbi:PPE family protein [Nocardia sp. CDC159]|uniref:PPE family protein n=1 Tax=Nocardia pulmonis TaxID=2951408 RepID=A0A9X2IYX4_9NOCA|nr:MULTISPECIES: PPE domain-containing protein [Nocardia]MCM6776888.1 PPE family protein [Nocardia pulmonis]MCM6789312.1 PPE family protein [Nocardia sp. CDC159]
MTAGITGVFWLPRMAEANSISLNAGAHAIPISAAATAWGALTAAWVDATATVARVMAELGIGMQGVNGIAALARLTGFTGWAEQQGVLAAAMGAKAAANATAYTVASLAMPSLPEIAAVEAARVAAHSTGGALNGSAEVAEAAKAAMDLRAALVMETYEAATTAQVTTPNQFAMPPAIANGAGNAEAAQNSETAFQEGAQADPVQTAVAAAQAFISNPGVASAATQAVQFAGSMASTGVSTAGHVAGSAIAAATNAAAPSSVGIAPMAGLGAAAAGGGATAVATRAVSFGGSVGIGNGAGTLKLPEGWGAGSSFGGGHASVATAPAEPAVQVGGPAAARQNVTGANPLLGRQVQKDDEDETYHKGADYLHGDHFADGRVVAEGVIGGEATAGER